jgi:hypothetical protein
LGDDDGTVHWHQGVELYNVARRAGATLVMLVYGGEDARSAEDAQPDRLPPPYLRVVRAPPAGEPATPWITSGLRYIDRDRELKKGTGG